jgi:peptidyl-prolyl cis-trans isomerase C
MRIAALLTAVLILGLAGCGEPSGEDRVVARVGDREITLSQLRERYGLAAADSGTEERGISGLEEAARDWAAREILLQEAHQRGLEQDSSFLAHLEALRQDLLINLLTLRYAGLSEPDSSEVAEEYDVHREEYAATQDQIELTYVLAPEREAANLARRRMTEELDLEEVLASHESLTGAELGWVSPGDLNPAVSKTAFGLVPGGVSYPQKQDDGSYLILQCRRRRYQGTIRPLVEVYEEIHTRLLLQRQSEAEKAFNDSLWAVYRPEIRLGAGAARAVQKD